MEMVVWKAWAPSKCKHFSWLIIQNLVWTADRLDAMTSRHWIWSQEFSQFLLSFQCRATAVHKWSCI
jgi:hypothetical protein